MFLNYRFHQKTNPIILPSAHVSRKRILFPFRTCLQSMWSIVHVFTNVCRLCVASSQYVNSTRFLFLCVIWTAYIASQLQGAQEKLYGLWVAATVLWTMNLRYPFVYMHIEIYYVFLLSKNVCCFFPNERHLLIFIINLGQVTYCSVKNNILYGIKDVYIIYILLSVE